MEGVSDRQKILLKYLLSDNKFKPVKFFAKMLSCSDKTIRNDINCWQEQGIIIERISGKGIRLAENQNDSVNAILDKKDNNNGLSTKARRMKILFALLEGKEKRLSIQRLSDEYFVSKTSIVNDLVMIENEISRYNLKLHKDVRGTCLTGAETDIRRALGETINQFVKNKENNLQETYSRIDYDTLKELKQHFGEEKVETVKLLIEKIENYLNYKITEPYYINFVTHILILIRRIQHDKTIYAEFDSYRPPYNEKFYRAAKLMKSYIEEKFDVVLNEAEIFYIYRYLTSSGGITSVTEISNNFDNDFRVQAVATDIIEISLQVYPLRFSFSQTLYKALLLHIRPMLNRVIYKIYIKNPILEEVNTEFPEAMILLKLIMLKIQIKYDLPVIREDEIAYLAVYFQNAVEEIINKKKVIIVCSSGIGTSHLLEKRIKKYFPEWQIVDVTSAKTFEKIIDSVQIDLVIATVKLSISTNIPIAYVSALFNEKDAQKLRSSFVKQFPDMDKNNNKNSMDICNNDIKKINKGVYLADCIINPEIYVTIYENIQLVKSEIYFSSGDDDKKNIDVLLSNRKNLSADIIKKIYCWILENK
ncbi:BglG family transcription antiterminator [Pectinatus sottacetonis]|uniref:BglG family transcription antiterminator n=1 Tax=Pectinatus sottacetonis TaxID=1002795 RepID=UPI0018C797D3|nr:transcription antiterminator [Pectinatus sottacetonis]